MIRQAHHPFLRASGALLSLLLLLVQLADGTGVHKCPAHDGMGGPVVAMSHHGTMQHHTGVPAEHQHNGPCTCLGACHGASFALAAADGTPRLATDPRHTAVVDLPVGTAPASRLRLLPFANGPPRPVPSNFA